MFKDQQFGNYKFGYKIIDDIYSSLALWIWLFSYYIVSYWDDKSKSPMEKEREKEHRYLEESKVRLDVHYKYRK